MKTTRGLNLVMSVVAAATATTMLNVEAAQTKAAPKSVSNSIAKKSSKKTIVTKKAITSPAAVAPAQADSVTSSSSSASRASAPATALVAPVTAGVTTAATPSASNSLLDKDKMRVNLNFYYYGSSVTEPFGGYQPDFENNYAQSESSDPVTLETHLAIGYKVHPNVTLSLNPQFRTVAQNAYKDEVAGQAKFFTPIASYFRIQFGQFVKSGNFTWNGDLRIHPGITTDMHGNPIYLRSGQNFMFGLSDKLNFGLYNTLRYYYRTAATYADRPNANNFRVTSSPTLEYQVLDTLNLAISYNMDVAHPSNQSFGPRWWNDNNFTYTELAATWNITKTIEIAPYVDIYTSNHIDPNSMQLGANLSFTLL